MLDFMRKQFRDEENEMLISHFSNWQVPQYVFGIAATQLDRTSVPLTNQDLIHQTCHTHLSTFPVPDILHPRVSLTLLLHSGHKGTQSHFKVILPDYDNFLTIFNLHHHKRFKTREV